MDSPLENPTTWQRSSFAPTRTPIAQRCTACIRSTPSSSPCPTSRRPRASTTSFGLMPRREGGRLDLYTAGHPHPWGSLYQAGGVKKLQYLRFACFPEDFDAIAARIERLGVPRCSPHPLGDDSGLWVLHPEGFRGAGGGGRQDRAGRGQRARRRAAPARGHRRLAQPRAHPEGASAAALAHPDVQRQGGRGRALLRGGAGPARDRPLGRPHRLHARRARQRPPPDRHGAFERPGPAPPELGRGQHRRGRPRHGADVRRRPRARLGRGAPCAGLQLLPLRARPVGQLLGVLLRHGLRARRLRLAHRRPPARGLVLRLGPEGARGLHHQLREVEAKTETEPKPRPAPRRRPRPELQFFFLSSNRITRNPHASSRLQPQRQAGPRPAPRPGGGEPHRRRPARHARRTAARRPRGPGRREESRRHARARACRSRASTGCPRCSRPPRPLPWA
jgi:hypothetical protein